MKTAFVTLLFALNLKPEVFWKYDATDKPQSAHHPIYSTTIYEWGLPVQITVSHNYPTNKNPSIKMLSKKLCDGRWITVSYKAIDAKKLFN